MASEQKDSLVTCDEMDEDGKPRVQEINEDEEEARDPASLVAGPRSLNVDLNALTYGAIDWERVYGSLCWLSDKVQQTCEAEGKEKMEDYANGQSQFLAKTCVMHIIHTFHACRSDAPHGGPGGVENDTEAAREIDDNVGAAAANKQWRVAPGSEPAAESTPNPPPSATG